MFSFLVSVFLCTCKLYVWVHVCCTFWKHKQYWTWWIKINVTFPSWKWKHLWKNKWGDLFSTVSPSFLSSEHFLSPYFPTFLQLFVLWKVSLISSFKFRWIFENTCRNLKLEILLKWKYVFGNVFRVVWNAWRVVSFKKELWHLKHNSWKSV